MPASTRHSIARQVTLKFCGFAFFISAIFSFMTFVFLFAVEDQFLDRELWSERDRLTDIYQETGEWDTPLDSSLSLHSGVDELPADLRQQLVAEPETRKEFYGDQGRHYHVARLTGGMILVSEVSEKLLIRPLRNSILLTYGVLMLMLTAVGCFTAYRLAKRSISPLTNLAESMERATPENLPADFAGQYPDNEVGTLARALQASLGRIARFIRREQDFNRDVSHDLRTPIAVVSGAVEVLQKRHELDSDLAHVVNRIDVANKHMGRTVEALLSLAREDDTAALQQTTRLLPIVERTILQFSHLIDAKSIEIETDISVSAALSMQPGVLEILLSNLIGNALEYSEQGHVHIAFQGSQLSITDTAGGIDEAIRDTLFEAETKGHESSGFGRGLSIVKRVCEHHSVTINVEHLNGGTRITLGFKPIV